MPGIPSATGLDHVAVTVPDLTQAIGFFVDVLGAEHLYSAGPFSDHAGTAMRDRLRVDREAELELALVRLGDGQSVELLAWRAPRQAASHPRNSDIGACHLALRVTDMAAALAYLHDQPGVELQAGPNRIGEGPLEGLDFVYFTTPWGLQLELCAAPGGLGYERSRPSQA